MAAAPSSQTLERGKSSVTFRLNSTLFNVTGRLSDFSAVLSPGAAGLSGARLKARFNIHSVEFDPMPAEKLFMLKGMLALVRDPYVDFESTAIKVIDGKTISVDGMGSYERRKHPISFVAQLRENGPLRTRLTGSIKSDALSMPAVKSIEQFCGTFSGSAAFDLMFSARP